MVSKITDFYYIVIKGLILFQDPMTLTVLFIPIPRNKNNLNAYTNRPCTLQ